MCLFRVDPLAITATQRSSSLVRVHQGTNGNFKLFSGMLVDNYKVAMNIKRKCARVLLDLAWPLIIAIEPSLKEKK